MSVIVCFRNEADNLAACLEGILAQTYPPGFEVVLVDDNSTDGSTSVALAYAGYDDRIRIVYPGPTRPGKKDALAYGIEQSSYECMVLTDADCRPASGAWLATMAAGLAGNRELVLGVSPYLIDENHPWLSRWQQFESIYVAIKYLGFARRGVPFMGVGRNLAYTKGFYAKAGGFEGHADLPSGDDDLLVAGAAEPGRTSLVVSPRAWAWSRSHCSLPRYLHQRQRHQSTGTRYAPEAAILLGMLGLSHGLFYLLGAIALFYFPLFALVIYSVRLAVVFNTYHRVYQDVGADAGARVVGKGAHSVTWPWWLMVMIGDMLLAPMYLYLSVGNLGKSNNW